MPSHPTVAYFIPTLVNHIKELQYKKFESCFICTTDTSLQLLECKSIDSKNDFEVSIQFSSIVSILEPHAKYVVLLHNHPSQKSYPSRADFIATQKLVNLGEMLNFKVLDHIIVTQNDYFSFAEAGILDDIKNPYV